MHDTDAELTEKEALALRAQEVMDLIKPPSQQFLTLLALQNAMWMLRHMLASKPELCGPLLANKDFIEFISTYNEQIMRLTEEEGAKGER